MIDLTHLSLVFHAGTMHAVTALQDVSLHLEAGEFVTVIGSNGAGKSTLLNSIAGVYPLQQGQIVIAGRDVTHWTEHQRARFIGRVFQNPVDGTAASMSIEQNLALAHARGRALRLRPGVTRARRALFRQALATLGMGLEQRLTLGVHRLSGGQRQALTLLMATLTRPQILLLDEHTAALDPVAAAHIMQLTQRLVQEQQLTTLMVTHNMQQALAYGDRTLMLHRGQCILDIRGAPRQGLTVQDLIKQFTEARREAVVDDALLLGDH
ncbi:MAG: ABC transporter ATP-binding protein [Candidatus Tectimicrobiota bacterium]